MKEKEKVQIIELKDTNWVIKIPIMLWWVGIIGYLLFLFVIFGVTIATI